MANKNDIENITIPEITDRVYDTLMGNVGLSENHVFNPEDVINQECYAKDGYIALQFKNGLTVKLVIAEISGTFFDSE